MFSELETGEGGSGEGGGGARDLEVNVIQEEIGGGVSEIRLGKFPFSSFDPPVQINIRNDTILIT